MIDLVLITGFLGAGKTTLLRRLALHPPAGRRLAFIVNEFSDLNIDARLLPGEHRTYEVSGGSLFCECRVEDFVGGLREIERKLAGAEHPLVLVETSGIANPEAMGKLLRETGLDRDFSIARIVTIVAPYRFQQYIAAFPNLQSQIRTADTILLNKTDTAADDRLDAVEAELRRMNPAVTVIRTRYAETAADLLTPAGARGDLEGDLETCANPYTTFRLRLLPPVSAEDVVGRLKGLDEAFLRLKGWIRDREDRVHYVSFSQGSWEIRPEPADSAANQLVLIAPESAETDVTAFIDAQPDLEILSET